MRPTLFFSFITLANSIPFNTSIEARGLFTSVDAQEDAYGTLTPRNLKLISQPEKYDPNYALKN